MGFYSTIRGPIKAVLDDLVNDQDLRKQVTYRRYIGQTFDASAGATVNTYSDTVCYAIKLKHNFKSIQESSYDVEVNDDLYMFKSEDLPSVALLSTKDQIRDENSNTLKIKGIDNIFDLAVSVTVEGG